MADTIRALAEEYNEAWETLDIASIVEFHGMGFEYYWFNTRVAEDFEDVLRDVWLAETKEYEIEISNPGVEVLGTDAAVISFLFNDREVSLSGDVVTSEGAMIYVFERREGRWKIVRIHHSGPVPEGY